MKLVVKEKPVLDFLLLGGSDFWVCVVLGGSAPKLEREGAVSGPWDQSPLLLRRVSFPRDWRGYLSPRPVPADIVGLSYSLV